LSYHHKLKKVKKMLFLRFLFVSFVFISFNHFSFNHSLFCHELFIENPAERKLWVEKCVEKYPEILWLANSQVRKTEEGQTSKSKSYSEYLFGEKFIEFDRTIMTLYCLNLILDGTDSAYQQFTQDQPFNNKLSKKNFEELHQKGQYLLGSRWEGLSSDEMKQTMETALVLGDMGKSEKARQLFAVFQVGSPDHDDFHEEALKVLKKHPDLCPSFAKLPFQAKKLLLKTANLAHYGHITHLEGNSLMFHKLKESEIILKDPTAFCFDIFIHICDVAGAAGHTNQNSSLSFTQTTHQAIKEMEKSLNVFANPNKLESDALNSYLLARASWLGLNPQVDIDRVLTRLGAMLRLFSYEDGVILNKAIHQLEKPILESIIYQLDPLGKRVPVRTPTYIPAVFLNLASNQQLGNTQEERLIQAVVIGLPFIAAVQEKYEQMIEAGEIDSNIPLNFNQIASIAKTHPKAIKGDFSIDIEGNVLLRP
jgi:hypothetical protein